MIRNPGPAPTLSFDHRGSEDDVSEALRGTGEDLTAARGARMKRGTTASGRDLRVIDLPDEQPRSAFVITAYELQGKAKQAFRRRRRRKRR